MDIYIRGVPPQSTDKELEAFLRHSLKHLSIYSFTVSKPRAKNFAILTLPGKDVAELFLRHHGNANSSSQRGRFKKSPGLFDTTNLQYDQNKPSQAKPLVFQRHNLIIAPSNRKPDEHALRNLQHEAKLKLRRLAGPISTATVQSTQDRPQPFFFNELACGFWDYHGKETAFVPAYRIVRPGRLIIGKSGLAIMLSASLGVNPMRIDVRYFNIDCIINGSQASPTVTISLFYAPKMYEDTASQTATTMHDLTGQLAALNMNIPQGRRPEKTRLTSLGPDHEAVVGSCFVYQVRLSSYTLLQDLYKKLKAHPGLPSVTPLQMPPIKLYPFASTMSKLNASLSQYERQGKISWGLRFQLEALAVNGKLKASKVLALLDPITRIREEYGILATITSVQQLAEQTPFPGPDVESIEFEHDTLATYLKEGAEAFRFEGSVYEHSSRHTHIALVHRVMITPAGMYLEGPTEEVTNRVLRKYPGREDYFLRVTFADEDSEMIRFDSTASLDRIFHARFKHYLNSGINIGGRVYMFLGFSHSSLRSQSCWFMAPFVHDGSLIHAQDVVKELGDFSSIQSPAKCAARIGQAFSDTTGSIHIASGNYNKELPDIERNGRTFSDGVGTISVDLIRRVWAEWAISRSLKPTCLQIRFGGAKGMVSLDTRLKGEQLLIRKSMDKFPSTSEDLELCGANFKPLPMFLNRPLIKILEDIGVEESVIIKLQQSMVDRLRSVMLSPVNAANFLETNFIGKAAGLPGLIRRLQDMGLSFQEDEFLRSTVEMVALVQLRDIKHRGRILVENGVTLYGIMDETNFLKPEEIYCVTETADGGRRVLVGGNVVITRAPALHPGDVQVVKAVDVPKDSPLNALHNCVVFSQQGDRDLPSQLSGGDLDGDLYNVIFDPSMMPKRHYSAADYPRLPPIDIERPVERQDMTDFFVKFMETDQLGRISNLHLHYADVEKSGTVDPTCLKLAGLASTAVDFSKTGIAVNLNEIPRAPRYRPDFMAPGPRVKIEKIGDLSFEDADDGLDEEVDPVAALDPDTPRFRYYESEKVLGKLFRAIDEHKFFQEMHAQGLNTITGSDGSYLMDKVWRYVERETALIQWEHHRSTAREIRDNYEDNLLHNMTQNSPHHKHALTEVEVFAESILGKSFGANNKRVREISISMKERFERDVAFTVERITRSDDGTQEEALERSVACLAIAIQEQGRSSERGRGDPLQSWKYVAASVCLKEVEKFQSKSNIFGGRLPLRPL